ncbi:hypothetical protein [Streptomyces hoynatensis]|uniref:EamA/RhaT family transporter n=1 Tax=Streptomyces hoynatensis TaxID=1141874 RepID=A0A3A9Z4X8_9ACTN|nr:hypothetical protein [Streptomyces hoynatensis]RKN42914.1 hypothetical protein D7294_10285 [Streptomyces hoynatensis]
MSKFAQSPAAGEHDEAGRHDRQESPQGPESPGSAEREEGPRPEPLRFYGTSWVDHSRHYGLRRAALTAGAALLTLAGVLVLWLGYVGLVGTGSGGWLGTLVVLAFVLCTALAFTRAWSGYVRAQPADGPDESQFRTIKVVGFVGLLLAYTLRSLAEAPGERLRRADYEAAVERHKRRTVRRSGNPARRRERRRR